MLRLLIAPANVPKDISKNDEDSDSVKSALCIDW